MSKPVRNGSDTWVGFIPGSDINEGTGASVGGLAATTGALKTLAGWTGQPFLGGYTYPSGGSSELWDFQKAQGSTVKVAYKSFAIPNGKTIADVRSGACDAIWTQRAHDMVNTGQGDGFYEPGYEGSDKNFNGSAGQVVPAGTGGAVNAVSGLVLGAANWAYAVSRQIQVMRQVAGWDPWIAINYDCSMASAMGLDSDPFDLITQSFDSIEMELYPYDSFSGTWSASNPADHAQLITYTNQRIAAQQVACQKYGKPIGFGEAAPMINPNGHSSGDDAAWVQYMKDYCMDLSHNVARIQLYNGTTGDTSRCFNWNQTTKTYTKNTAQFPLSSQKIIDIFDPANFINRTPTGGGTTYTQAQLDAAVAAQKALDDASTGATVVNGLNAQIATLTGQKNSLTTELNEAYAQIALTKSLWLDFFKNIINPAG